MKIKKIEIKNVKAFSGVVPVDFPEGETLFAFSGTNGAGKSTLLKVMWLIQKLHFVEKGVGRENEAQCKAEVFRYLTSTDSYATLTLLHEGKEDEISLSRDGSSKGYKLTYKTDQFVSSLWNPNDPTDLILYVDASKGFSEDTLKFDELNIDDNERTALSMEAIFRPEQLFSGIYRQLVKDYVHSRLIPSKPDRLLYYHVASKLFTKLIPNVELRNFSGNYKPKEFVLLGKANNEKHKPLYDVREFSSGEKALLSTLTFLCISKSVSALIIDEPENHFHESLLLEFMSVLHRLCEKGGIISWVSEANGGGKKLNQDWVETEYAKHNINQVIISTHSKPLIYKTFSLGLNYIVHNGVRMVPYEGVESELRKIGLSTTYSKVLLVEGDGDHAALENLLKGKNIKVQPLNGSKAVTETFKRLAEVRNFIHEARFVFLVDSDNKPQQFFDELRAIDEDFYNASFVVIDAHEFENLFLDVPLFEKVIDGYAKLTGNNTILSQATIGQQLTALASSSLPQVHKKQISLSFQQLIERHFSDLIWGNKNFNWSSVAAISQEIGNVLAAPNNNQLNASLTAEAQSIFSSLGSHTGANLLKRCDGKQVLGKACAHFAAHCGVSAKKFREAVYHAAISDKNSKIAILATDLINRLEKKD